MKTVGYLPPTLTGVLFVEPLTNVDGEMIAGQKEVVLRAEAQGLIDSHMKDATNLAELLITARKERAGWESEAKYYLTQLENVHAELAELKRGNRITRALRILFTGE